MQAFNKTTQLVAAQLTGDAPNYMDAETKFVYREVSRVALNELTGNLAHGFRALAVKTPNMSPMTKQNQRNGCVLINNVAQKGTEGMTLVGLFDLGVDPVAVYNTENGFCVAEQGTDATKGYFKNLDEGKVYDGKLVEDKVLQVVLRVGSEYSLGLLLTEAQLDIEGVADLLRTVEKKKEVENDNNDPLETEKANHAETTRQLADEKQDHGTTKKLLELANERYSFFSGFAACFVLAVVAYAIKEGHLRVPKNVRLWSTIA